MTAPQLHYADDHLTVYIGDCREVMAAMEPGSVHCVVTSPPYWGLRDYGVAGQLGLEPTLEEYVANMVAVFREIRRVLRADGTVWLNLGDSYAGGGRGGNPNESAFRKQATNTGSVTGRAKDPGIVPDGLKPKDLVGVPWRVAFALQADGWYLRSDIIWSKPNPMPESVTDRPTKAHEYLFLLSKSPRYYFDAEAVRERAESGPSDLRKMAEGRERIGGMVKEQTDPLLKASALTNIGRKRSVGGKQIAKQDGGQQIHGGDRMTGFNGRWDASEDNGTAPDGRNLRSVWTIATQPYPGAHFATFPEKLVEPCVKAGTSERGVCPECGAPWVRETRVEYDAKGRTTNGPRSVANHDITAGFAQRLERRVETTGWRPICAHYPRTADWPVLPVRERDEDLDDWLVRSMPERTLRAELLDAWTGEATVPAAIMDPFAGSGTTARVANRLGRRAVLIDLSADYIDQAMSRNAQAPLGLGA